MIDAGQQGWSGDDASDVVLAREQMSVNCGCQAKTSGDALRRQLPVGLGPGVGDADDCAVVTVGNQKLLFTLDYGPLVGPSVERAGRIAARHAMSDIYAMGGVAIFAAAIVATSPHLPEAALGAMVRGLHQACEEEGVTLVGGHTIEDGEPLAGLAVIGVPGPRLLKKSGATPGDILMVSKPLGTGMLVRAYRLGNADDAGLEAALSTMELSNASASRAAIDAGASALTDVTGYGLLGHTAEVLAQSGVGAVINLEAVPVLPAAAALPRSISITRFTDANFQYAHELVDLVGVEDRMVLGALLDPQTSGGLLATVAPSQVGILEQAGYVAIGTITEENEMEVR